MPLLLKSSIAVYLKIINGIKWMNLVLVVEAIWLVNLLKLALEMLLNLRIQVFNSNLLKKFKLKSHLIVWKQNQLKSTLRCLLKMLILFTCKFLVKFKYLASDWIELRLP